MVNNTGGDVCRARRFAGLKGAEAARLVYRRSCIRVAKTSSKLSKSLRSMSLQVDGSGIRGVFGSGRCKVPADVGRQALGSLRHHQGPLQPFNERALSLISLSL